MSNVAIDIKEKTDAGEEAKFQKTKKEEADEEAKSKFDASEMKTYVMIPHKLPDVDPIWIIKKFKGQMLNADEIDEYMVWKQ